MISTNLLRTKGRGWISHQRGAYGGKNPNFPILILILKPEVSYRTCPILLIAEAGLLYPNS
eukprot:1214663-Amorphochlora_amoeboformis.AAC.1